MAFKRIGTVTLGPHNFGSSPGFSETSPRCGGDSDRRKNDLRLPDDSAAQASGHLLRTLHRKKEYPCPLWRKGPGQRDRSCDRFRTARLIRTESLTFINDIGDDPQFPTSPRRDNHLLLSVPRTRTNPAPTIAEFLGRHTAGHINYRAGRETA